MTEEEKVHLIEGYINDMLSEEEVAAIRRRIEQDPDFADEVTLHRSIVKAIEVEGKMKSFKANLAKLRSKDESHTMNRIQKPAPDHYGLWRWVSGIAAVIVVGMFIYLVIHKDSDYEEVFSNYYKPYPSNILASSVRGENTQSLELQALGAYENQDFQLAIPLLKAASQANPSRKEWQFFLGIAYLEVGQLEVAHALFEGVVASETNVLVRQAKWYNGLVLLKQKKIEEAKEHFVVLSEDDDTYGRLATEILGELD